MERIEPPFQMDVSSQTHRDRLYRAQSGAVAPRKTKNEDLTPGLHDPEIEHFFNEARSRFGYTG
jgi:hypothetical protein